MLSDLELLTLLDTLGTPSEGRKLVEKARKVAPTRQVKSSGGNVVTHYYSVKMVRHLVLESRGVEFPASLWYEFDKSVLEYYAQPVPLDLILTDAVTAKPYRLQHYPDFLVITPHQIFLDEWREEHRLLNLSGKYPGRYLKDERGWHFPALEEHLSEKGIRYRLRSADELPRQFIHNIQFLGEYMDKAYPPLSKDSLSSIQGFLGASAALPLIKFIDKAVDPCSGFTPGQVYKAIADGLLACNLDRDSIADTERTLIYRDASAMAFHRHVEDHPSTTRGIRRDVTISIGSKIDYDGVNYEVGLIGQGKILLKSADSTSEVGMEVVRQLQAEGRLLIHNSDIPPAEVDPPSSLPGPKALDRILHRMELVEMTKEQRAMVSVSDRTLRRYRSAVKQAGDGILDRHLALADRYNLSGNRLRKIPIELEECIKNVVNDVYNKPTCPSKRAAFRVLLMRCYEQNLNPCSERTFLKELAKLKSTRKRQGNRVDYQEQPIVDYLYHSMSVHGERPFEFVHIDHTPLEIYARSPEEKDSLGGVWLSLAMDTATRLVLGFYLTFEKPSYRSVMMVIRDIVRRHGRMPEMIVVDNGADFRSGQLKRLCSIYGCSLRYRPKGKPRFGSVLERLFGTLHTQLIHQLPGNTQIHKFHRSMTKAVRPDRFVESTLFSLHAAVGIFFEVIYGTENHPALGEPPIQYFDRRLRETGERYRHLVAFDRNFKIETCPAPKGSGTRVVDGIRGVKINHFWYWNDTLGAPNLTSKAIQVRIDPWDPGVAFVLIDDTWQECVSKWRSLLRNLTECELRYSTEALLKKHGIRKKDLTPERMAEWVRILDVQKLDPRLAKQQAEARYLYQQLGMSTVSELPSEDTEEPKGLVQSGNLGAGNQTVFRKSNKRVSKSTQKSDSNKKVIEPKTVVDRVESLEDGADDYELI